MERERHKRHRSSDSDADAGTSHAGRDPLIPAAPPDAAVMRAADGNGVHESAETAVGQAASSSGSPLPGALMRKFEGSLGADLGGVRVHTGAASQAAAASVGARAYAVGQDIHFGAGQFDPGSRSGQHLIAHEVAHTVQQASGAARKPMFKLQVSSPGDSHEVEADRAADAMVAGSGALVGSADRGLARAPQSCEAPSSKPKNFLDEVEDKQNGKCEMPDPVSNYSATNLPSSLRKKIRALSIDSLRSLANDMVDHAYTNFTAACIEKKTKVSAAKKEREDAEQKKVDFILGAVGLMMGPVGAAMGAKVAGPVLQASLKSRVEGGLPALLTSAAAVDKEVAKLMTNDVYKAIASDTVTGLAARLTPEAASGLVGAAAGAVAKAATKIDLNGSHEDKTISFLDGLMVAGDASTRALMSQVGTSNDEDGLMGVYCKFSGASITQYRVEIDEKANHFMEQIAKSVGPESRQEVVTINAYGRPRLASVLYRASFTDYVFKSWITPDMEAAARQTRPNIREILPQHIHGHIPCPETEGAKMGEEVVVKMDAWGRMRMAVVKSDGGEIGFVRWILASQIEEATIRGAGQIGGIRTIEPKTCKGGIGQPPKGE